ncbi:glycosyltransferase [Vibrio vulnificus]|uniref:glycosyltransferase n=1 Tax=Vibrio vulnificus TaxID=672 RepID=UPI0028A3E440|nr:glycosyltransferase [Vibrio vulnificus]
MRKKKILFVHHGVGLGGAPKSMSLLVNAMKNRHDDVEVLFLKKSEASTLIDTAKIHVNNIPIKYFNHSSRWYRWYEIHIILIQIFSWLMTVLILAPYWLIKIKPDIVYLNSSVLTDWAVSCKFFRKKVVIHIRESIADGYLGIRKWFIRNIINNTSSRVILLSSHNYKCINTCPEKSVIIPNYVEDRSVFNSDKVYDFIYLGGEKDIKGIDLIEKLILCDRRAYNICLLGYYSKDFINKYGNLEGVILKGAVTNAMEYISQSKFLLFPATTPHFPRPVIEAFSMKTIPLASDLAGIEEIIDNNIDGILFRTDDFDDMCLKIDFVLKLSTEKIDRMSLDGFRKYKCQFSEINQSKIIHLITD